MNKEKTAEQLIKEFNIQGQIEVILHSEEDTWFGKALANLTSDEQQESK